MYLDERRQLSVPKAAEELGTTSRTVYRDLEVLQRVGMPLYTEAQGRRARWRLDEGYRRRLSITVSSTEAMALVAARSLLVMMEGTPFAKGAASLAEKLRTTLPLPLRQRVDALAPRVTAGSGPAHSYESRGPVLEKLLEATASRKVVRLTYRKLGDAAPAVHLVEPHHLHMHGGAFYVIGYSRTRRAPRLFLLDRIGDAALTLDGFAERPEVAPMRFIHGAFGLWDGPPVQVRLRFTGGAARIVAEQRWHPTQRSQWRSDGALDVSFEVPLTPALTQWIRGYGEDVEVLAPRKIPGDLRPQVSHRPRTTRAQGG